MHVARLAQQRRQRQHDRECHGGREADRARPDHRPSAARQHETDGRNQRHRAEHKVRQGAGALQSIGEWQHQQ